MKRKMEVAPESAGLRAIPLRPFDEADWVDWDHWQTVEELQNFMNGLTDMTSAEEIGSTISDDGRGQTDHIARQIQRHGLDIDG